MNPNPMSADGVMVWVGKHNLTSNEGIGFLVGKIMIHPDWDPTAESFDADIAVVKTRHKLSANFFPNVKAININSLKSLPTIGQVVRKLNKLNLNVRNSTDYICVGIHLYFRLVGVGQKILIFMTPVITRKC